VCTCTQCMNCCIYISLDIRPIFVIAFWCVLFLLIQPLAAVWNKPTVLTGGRVCGAWLTGVSTWCARAASCSQQDVDAVLCCRWESCWLDWTVGAGSSSLTAAVCVFCVLATMLLIVALHLSDGVTRPAFNQRQLMCCLVEVYDAAASDCQT